MCLQCRGHRPCDTVTNLSDIRLHFWLGGPLGGDIRVGVTLAGVCHAGINAPGIHVVPFALLVLQHKAWTEIIAASNIMTGCCSRNWTGQAASMPGTIVNGVTLPWFLGWKNWQNWRGIGSDVLGSAPDAYLPSLLAQGTQPDTPW